MKLEDIKKSDYIIYVDMDGVIADFVAGVDALFKSVGKDKYDESKYEASRKYRDDMWDTISKYQKEHGDTFWLNLPVMEDARELWDYVQQYKHEVLTAAGQAQYHAAGQKSKWIAKHFGRVAVHSVATSKEKAKFAAPKHILIDDRQKSIGPWIQAGGIGILHTSAADTIKQLKALGL